MSNSENSSAGAGSDVRQGVFERLSVPVLVVDASLVIVDANPALQRMLADLHADLRRDLPDLDPRALVGADLAVLEPRAGQLRQLLRELRTSPREVQVKAGGHTFAVTATRLDDVAGGEGTCLEWVDVTDRSRQAEVREELAGVMDAASRSDLSARVALDGVPEDQRRLCAASNLLLDTLQSLMSEMNHMSAEHDQGDIDVRIDAEKFSGGFREMAQGINDMVAGHIAVKKKAMAVVKAIGEGDFDAPLERFPGKKAFINETIEQLRANLKALVDAMNLATSGEAGRDVDSVIDADRFSGGYRTMALGVSDMVASHAAVRKAMDVVEAFGQGNFDSPMDTFTGKNAFITATIERVRANLKALVDDAGMLATAAVEGRLETRADAAKHQGDFRKIVEGVNGTLDVVVDKLEWYRSIIDAVPFPVHVTDLDMKWTFLNRAFEKLMVEQGYVPDREAAVGRPCSTANANICKTKNCGIEQLRVGVKESFFDWCGMNCKQDTAPVLNARGETVGYVETVTDLTSTLRVKHYTEGQVNIVAKNLERLGDGNLDLDYTLSAADEHTREVAEQFGKINESFRRVGDSLNALTTDAEMLATAAVEGRLATRADASKHQGDYRKIVEGVNGTLDSVIGPLNVAADYVDRIAKGETPPKITDAYNGDFNILKNNLNMCIDAIEAQARAAQGIAEGNLGVEINVRSESDVVAKSLVQVTEVLRKLQVELQRLTAASEEGLLSERGRPEQFSGAYAEVVVGVNKMLDAILLPIGEGNRVLELIRGGNLRDRVEIACKGDHDKMKQAINGVHGWLTELIDYVTRIANGDLTATMGKASDDDQIHEFLVMLKRNIQALVEDARMLADAAVAGRLETRADASKHQGDFKAIVDGVNNTLDAVIGPLNVAAGYVDKISKGDIPPKITDPYNGDFNVLKNNLNTCIDAVNLLVDDARMLATAAVEGRLETRADAAKHQGDFKAIVDGVNNTLDAVIG
ncbi:MAG TPA: PAS domain-containing protein, partial [Kineosporiaceae bacterium]|nr:PAS domain-containing protein [Kineosporiaceae bacterium]